MHEARAPCPLKKKNTLSECEAFVVQQFCGRIHCLLFSYSLLFSVLLCSHSINKSICHSVFFSHSLPVNGSYFLGYNMHLCDSFLAVLLFVKQYCRPCNRLLRLKYSVKSTRNKLVRRLLKAKRRRIEIGGRRHSLERAATGCWLPAECATSMCAHLNILFRYILFAV